MAGQGQWGEYLVEGHVGIGDGGERVGEAGQLVILGGLFEVAGVVGVVFDEWPVAFHGLMSEYMCINMIIVGHYDR